MIRQLLRRIALPSGCSGGGRCPGSGDGGPLPRRHGPGDALQIAGHDPPADPAAHAVLAVIAATAQPVAALQHADPTFDPGPEAEATPEPALLVEAGPLRRDLAARRDDHPPAAGRLGQPLVLRREYPSVAGHQPRRPAETLLVRRQAWQQIRGVLARPVEQAPAADDPALDLLQPQLAAELDRLAGLVADDDLAVRLEQAHDLLARGYRLTSEHATNPLCDRLRPPRKEGVELPCQALSRRLGSLPQRRADPGRLRTRLPGDRDQPGVGLPHRLGRRLTLAPAEAMQAPHQAPRRAQAGPEQRLAQAGSLTEHGPGATQHPA